MNKHIGLLILLVAGNISAGLNQDLSQKMLSLNQVFKNAKQLNDSITQKLIQLVKDEGYFGNEEKLVRTLKQLLAQGANPDALYDDTPILVHLAWSADALNVLLEYNAEIQGNAGRDALMRACADEHFDSAKILLEQGVDSNITDIDGYTTALLACISDYQMVKLLLEYGADPKLPGNLPVYISCGLSVDGVLYDDEQEFMMASIIGADPQVLEILLQYGANPNALNVTNIHALTPLMGAVNQASFWAMQDPEGMGYDFAAMSLEKVKILLKCGADYRIKDTSGRNALHKDFTRGNQEIINLILEHSK